MSYSGVCVMDVIFRKSAGTAERPDDFIPCRTAFEYEGEAWRALAFYPCRSGIVLDLCREIPEGGGRALPSRVGRMDRQGKRTAGAAAPRV